MDRLVEKISLPTGKSWHKDLLNNSEQNNTVQRNENCSN